MWAEVVLLTATFYPKTDGVCVSFSIFPSTADQNLNVVMLASLDHEDESVHGDRRATEGTWMPSWLQGAMLPSHAG